MEKDEGVQGEKKRTFPQKVFSSPPAINQSSFITQPNNKKLTALDLPCSQFFYLHNFYYIGGIKPSGGIPSGISGAGAGLGAGFLGAGFAAGLAAGFAGAFAAGLAAFCFRC